MDLKVKSSRPHNENISNCILDEYIKVRNSDCLSGEGYGTLMEAKYACSNNKACVGILDEGCKDDFEFYLCLDFFSEDKELPSCIYKKNEAKGNICSKVHFREEIFLKYNATYGSVRFSIFILSYSVSL